MANIDIRVILETVGLSGLKQTEDALKRIGSIQVPASTVESTKVMAEYQKDLGIVTRGTLITSTELGRKYVDQASKTKELIEKSTGLRTEYNSVNNSIAMQSRLMEVGLIPKKETTETITNLKKESERLNSEFIKSNKSVIENTGVTQAYARQLSGTGLTQEKFTQQSGLLSQSFEITGDKVKYARSMTGLLDKAYKDHTYTEAQLNEKVNQVRGTIGLAGTGAKNFSQNLNELNAQTELLGKSTGRGIAGMAQWALGWFVLYRAIRFVVSGITESIKTIVDFDTTVKNLQAIMEITSKTASELASSGIRMAIDYGKSVKEVASIMDIWARQGKTTNETLELTKATLLLSNVAVIDAGTAAKNLTSILATFGIQAKDSTTVVDKLTALDLKFAVSAGQIAEALGVAGSTAAEFGLTLEETMAIISAVTERTQRGASQVGNAMRIIFTRIRRPEVIENLFELAKVTSYTQTGFRRIMDVMTDLRANWSNLSEEERKHLAFSIAGERQTDKFLATISAFSRVQEGVAIAQSASGQAMDKNRIIMESLSKQTEQLFASMRELAIIIGKAGVQQALGALLSILNIVVDSFKTATGQAILLTTAIIGITIASTIFSAQLGALLVRIGAIIISFGIWNIVAAAVAISLIAIWGAMEKGQKRSIEAKEAFLAQQRAMRSMRDEAVKLKESTGLLTEEQKRLYDALKEEYKASMMVVGSREALIRASKDFGIDTNELNKLLDTLTKRQDTVGRSGETLAKGIASRYNLSEKERESLIKFLVIYADRIAKEREAKKELDESKNAINKQSEAFGKWIQTINLSGKTLGIYLKAQEMLLETSKREGEARVLMIKWAEYEGAARRGLAGEYEILNTRIEENRKYLKTLEITEESLIIRVDTLRESIEKGLPTWRMNSLLTKETAKLLEEVAKGGELSKESLVIFNQALSEGETSTIGLNKQTLETIKNYIDARKSLSGLKKEQDETNESITNSQVALREQEWAFRDSRIAIGRIRDSYNEYGEILLKIQDLQRRGLEVPERSAEFEKKILDLRRDYQIKYYSDIRKHADSFVSNISDGFDTIVEKGKVMNEDLRSIVFNMAKTLRNIWYEEFINPILRTQIQKVVEPITKLSLPPITPETIRTEAGLPEIGPLTEAQTELYEKTSKGMIQSSKKAGVTWGQSALAFSPSIGWLIGKTFAKEGKEAAVSMGAMMGAQIGTVAGAGMAEKLGKVGGPLIGGIFGGLIGGFLGLLAPKPDEGDKTRDTINNASETVTEAIEASNKELGIVNRNLSALRRTMEPYPLIESFYFRSRPMGQFQFGGTARETGYYKIEAGEKVLRKGESAGVTVGNLIVHVGNGASGQDVVKAIEDNFAILSKRGFVGSA